MAPAAKPRAEPSSEGADALRGRTQGRSAPPSGSPQVTRFDLHAHSLYSPDARGAVLEMARAARAKGVRGLAVTDHNDVRSHAEVRRLRSRAELGDMVLVPGIELSTSEGHLLAIGVREAVPPHRSLADSIDAVRAAGGVPVVSHPERRVNGAGGKAVAAVASRLPALEVFNARELLSGNNAKAQALARAHGLGGTGGSDGHNVVDVGNGFTVTPEPCASVDDLLAALERKRTWGEGATTPAGQILRQAARNLGGWVRRGFRKV